MKISQRYLHRLIREELHRITEKQTMLSSPFGAGPIEQRATVPRPYITVRIDNSEAPNQSVALHRFEDKIRSLGDSPSEYSMTCSQEAGGWQCQAVKHHTGGGEQGLTFPEEEGSAAQISEQITLRLRGHSDWQGWTSGIYEEDEEEDEESDESQHIIESKYAGMSVSDVLSFFERYAGNTWIFFDTETMGFKPHEQQLTEIGAIAISPDGWTGDPQVLGMFNEKISLQPDTVKRIEKHKALSPEEKEERGGLTAPEILSMTRYGERGREYKDEQDVLSGFFEFVRSFSSPVLVAQNASFDMEFISVRSGGRLGRYPVIDTMRIMQLFLIPLLQTMRDSGDTEASEFLEKIKRGRGYTASMGVVSAVYGISTDEWHNALADVQMLMKLFQHVIDTLRGGEDVDISQRHSQAAKRFRTRRR